MQEHFHELPNGAGRIRFLRRPGTKPALVFLHGLGDCADVWRPTIGHLTEPCEVIALDLPGHGGSSRLANQDYDAARLREAVAAVIAGTGPLVLIGHSLGGEVSLALQAAAPEHIIMVVLVDFAAVWSEGVVEAVKASLLPMFRTYESLRQYAEALYERLPVADWNVVSEYAQHNLVAEADGRWRLRTDPAVLDMLDRSLPQEGQAMTLLAKVTCPVTVIRGEYSGVLTMSVARAMCEAASGHSDIVIVPRAGHTLPLDAPAALGRAIASLPIVAESRRISALVGCREER